MTHGTPRRSNTHRETRRQKARDRRLRNRKPSMGHVPDGGLFALKGQLQRDSYPGSMPAPTKLYGPGRSESFLLSQ